MQVRILRGAHVVSLTDRIIGFEPVDASSTLAWRTKLRRGVPQPILEWQQTPYGFVVEQQTQLS